jgi:hypothetical protein
METVRRRREAEARLRRERRLRSASIDGRYRAIPDWAEPARGIKLTFVEKTDRGDLPPTVVARRRGRDEAIVIAPQVDKMLGLQAASTLRFCMDSDELIFVTDAHAYRGREEDYEEAKKRWPGGLMQEACDQHGACATGEIMDCLSVVRIAAGGGMSFASMGYHYHGVGTRFRWDDDAAWWTDRGDLSGFIPDSLRKIMRGPSLLESPSAAILLRKFPGSDPERARYLFAEAGLRKLLEEGFLVMDLLTGTGPLYSPCGPPSGEHGS